MGKHIRYNVYLCVTGEPHIKGEHEKITQGRVIQSFDKLEDAVDKLFDLITKDDPAAAYDKEQAMEDIKEVEKKYHQIVGKYEEDWLYESYLPCIHYSDREGSFVGPGLYTLDRTVVS